jgi:putative hydrolase of the HAD superfamily
MSQQQQQQIKAVIFDYGGVLCKLPTEAQVQAAADLCRLSQPDFLKHFWHYRLAYDRGDLDSPLYWKSIAKSAGMTFAPELVDQLMVMDTHFWLVLDEPMLEWNRALRKAGFKTAILSNMPDILGIHLRQHSNLFNQFDAVTLSYEIRSAKPESKIYRRCLAQLGLKAGNVLFLDDKTTNVHAAQAVGLHALLYKSRADLAGRELSYGLPPVPVGNE